MSLNDSRRKWLKINVPENLFHILIFIAMSKGYNERTLYMFLYQALKDAYPEELELVIKLYGEPWSDDNPPPDPPPIKKP